MADLAKAKSWYSDRLGWDPVLEPPGVDQGLAPHAQRPGDHLAVTALDDRADDPDRSDAGDEYFYRPVNLNTRVDETDMAFRLAPRITAPSLRPRPWPMIPSV